MTDNMRDKIEEAKNTLGENTKNVIAELLHLQNFDGKKALSPFRDEAVPSFVWYPQGHFFKDFGSGVVVGITDAIMIANKVTYFEAVKELFDMVGFVYNDDEFRSVLNKDGYKTVRLARDEPDNDRKNVEEFLAKRKISPKTLDFCDVKQSVDGMIAYQLKDENGKLVSTKYRQCRNCDNSEQYKWLWQTDNDCKSLLYGMNRVDITKPLVITEGYNDRLAVVEAGYKNCVSIPGGANDFKYIDFCYDFLDKFSEIIVWYDDDNAGQTAVKTVSNRLGEYRTKIVSPTQEIKEAILAASHGKTDKADANNVLIACGASDVLRLIESAKLLDNPKLKPLFEFEPIDLTTVPRISTGLKAVDKVITGNFEGDFVVLAGYSGSGKSTLTLNMGIIAPLESGRKVMVFSGEASAPVLLSNMLRPLAGRRHIIEWDNHEKNIPNSYSVVASVQEQIRDFYKDKVWIYDDNAEMTTSADSILKTMEYSYRRYGVTVFLLDNLMTIATTENDEENKYSSQIKFCIALKKFTRKFNATVILVAHNKKPTEFQKEVTQYSVAGASEIVNLADRGIAINILRDDPEGYNNMITITKDRFTGRMGEKIKLYYDRPSNRIYSDTAELNRVYQWEDGYKYDYKVLNEGLAKKNGRVLTDIVKTDDGKLVEKEVFGYV